MTCAHCEEQIERREDGAWTSPEVAMRSDLPNGDEGVYVYPRDPHCYWAPNGKHEPEGRA